MELFFRYKNANYVCLSVEMNVRPMVLRSAAPRLRRSLFRKLTTYKSQSIRYFC